MKTKIVFCFLIIFAAVSVHAEPVYLSCYLIESGGEKNPIDITLDEANQKVMWVLQNGRTANTTGLFKADRVVFFDPGGGYPLQYTIDRVNLSFQRTLTIEAKQWNNTGMCSILQAPTNRKF